MSGPRAIIVTGAGRGIGLAIARHLASSGDRLVLNDLDEESLAAACREVEGLGAGGSGPRVVPVVGDVADPATADRLAAACTERFGSIDGLVNNAGIGGTGKALTELSLDEWNRMLAVDLTSLFLTCRAVFPTMTAQGRGRIVNIASVSALMGVAGSTHYTAAKAGVIGFSKSLAREGAPHRINVNVVAPGLVETEMSRTRGIDHQRHLVAWPRIGTPEDIAETVAFLLSDGAEFITGQVISPNGGALM